MHLKISFMGCDSSARRIWRDMSGTSLSRSRSGRGKRRQAVRNRGVPLPGCGSRGGELSFVWRYMPALLGIFFEFWQGGIHLVPRLRVGGPDVDLGVERAWI